MCRRTLTRRPEATTDVRATCCISDALFISFFPTSCMHSTRPPFGAAGLLTTRSAAHLSASLWKPRITGTQTVYNLEARPLLTNCSAPSVFAGPLMAMPEHFPSSRFPAIYLLH